MTLNEFLVVYAACLATMLLCRCIPIFYLKGRDLPEKMSTALNLIPPAAFSALVANDLFKPGMFSHGLVDGMIPIAAALIVVVVARKTRSLIWCAVAGIVAYALLSFVL